MRSAGASARNPRVEREQQGTSLTPRPGRAISATAHPPARLGSAIPGSTIVELGGEARMRYTPLPQHKPLRRKPDAQSENRLDRSRWSPSRGRSPRRTTWLRYPPRVTRSLTNRDAETRVGGLRYVHRITRSLTIRAMLHTCTSCGRISTEKRCPRHGPIERSRSAQRGFRKAVLQRDHFTCQGCGARGPDADLRAAHYPVPARELPGPERFDPSRGVTLCRRCDVESDPYARDIQLSGPRARINVPIGTFPSKPAKPASGSRTGTFTTAKVSANAVRLT